MNNLKKIFIIMFLLMGSCFAVSQEEKLTLTLLNEFANEQKKENNLTLVGVGCSIPSQIKSVTINLESTRELTLNQARELFAQLAEKLLFKFNSSAPIRPYLMEYPLNISHVHIFLGFQRNKEGHPAPPFISLVHSSNNKIYYAYYNASKDILETIYSEPFSETLKK